MPSPRDLESRLARVEQALAVVSAEVVAIRAALEASHPAPDDPAASASAHSSATQRFGSTRQGAAEASQSGGVADRSSEPLRDASVDSAPPRRRRSDITVQDLEGLLGRYGMLGIAVLAAAAAVGTFLSWAITRGYLELTPAVRVAIGLVFAAAIGIWGVRVRRTERSFGSSLVGLALVIAHICAYAAGPGFRLVPTIVAFGGAAAVSWALALFALGENDEPLWCVGLGGASVAPFVTSGGTSSVYTLLGYGVLVTLPASLAISHRDWPVAWRVYYAVTALFAVVGAYAADGYGVGGALTALAFPFVIAAAGVIPFAPETRKRGALRWLVALALLVGTAGRVDHTSVNAESPLIAGALVAAAFIALIFADRHVEVAQSSMFTSTRASPILLDWIDAGVMPFLFVLLAGYASIDRWSISATYGTGVGAFSIYSWRRPVGMLRDASGVAAVMLGVVLIQSMALVAPVGQVAGCLVVALLALWMHVLRPSRGWLGAGAATMVLAAGLSTSALLRRPLYAYSPFMTAASAASALVTVSLILSARFWPTLLAALRATGLGEQAWKGNQGGGQSAAMHRRGAVAELWTPIAAPWVWAFLWILMELAMAYSASTSTLLLVVYFASTAVACVAVGRARQVALLRQIGLALALTAAGTAIYGASVHFDIGARIIAYLVISGFLLGIAYWYRRPGGGVAAGYG